MTGEALVVDGGLTAMGPRLSRRRGEAPNPAFNFVGLDKGTTGEAPIIRKVATPD